ncbi:MAG TPA: universal stress protein [Fluviicoccus sp.]|nr:universal stress protein [Fluviicoccus sp.]
MKILVAVDLHESCDVILAHAGKLAKAFDAKLILLHVTDIRPELTGYDIVADESFGNFPDPQLIRDSIADRFREEHEKIQTLSLPLRNEGVECTALLVNGMANHAESILEETRKHAAEMIVIGTHRKGVVARLLLGSTSSGVLQHATVPVVMVPVVDKPAA